MFDNPLERSIQDLHLLTKAQWMMWNSPPWIAKKRRLGPQNGPISLGPEKM